MDGLSGTRLYAIFSGMKDRCYNEKNKITAITEAKAFISAMNGWGKMGFMRLSTGPLKMDMKNT